MSHKPVLGLTMGDPAGIGPELCLKALREPLVLNQCVPVVFGDAGILHRLTALGLPALEARCVSLPKWKTSGIPTMPTVVDCGALEATTVVPGTISAACGRAGYLYIEESINSALRGQVEGVVTAPIHKEALHLSGVKHPGHTEIFTALTGARRSCMMLRSEPITVSMVTTHIGYYEVPGKLSIDRICDVIELTAEAMQAILGRAAKIAVCGLNPHAGEAGLFGQREEERFVTPAIQRAVEKGLSVTGPIPPDAAFTPNVRKKFDAIVTLYHDQGHIPFKMLAFETGVNVTLGLPIIRTSVDHGTAFDIAWKGIADPLSLYEAIRVAVELAAGKTKTNGAKTP